MTSETTRQGPAAPGGDLRPPVRESPPPAVRYVPSAPSPRARIVRHAVGLLGFSVLLGLAATLGSDGRQVSTPSGQALPELCVLRQWTGLACPGCGLTRCFISMAHGDLASAWRFSPAGILFFLLTAAQLPLHAAGLARAVWGRAERAPSRWNARLLVAVAALLILQWVVRLLAGV